jgi:hypothetical protein
MDRRTFLGLTSAATIGVATLGCKAAAGFDERSLATPDILYVLGGGAVRTIGARYRSMAGSERTVASLRDAILDSRPLIARLAGAAKPTLSDLIRDDFTHGRTVVVDGWILSVTEARQCALYSFSRA